MSDAKKTFMVGNEKRELFFSFAVQRRLMGDFSIEKISEYIANTNFQLRALGLLLLGKEMLDITMVEDLIDEFEKLELSDDQAQEIIVWVRQRIINFTQKEVENIQAQVQSLVPLMESLEATSSGIKSAALKNQSA